jgi:malate dehydrogenase (oxaloacetate-decarboxylating)
MIEYPVFHDDQHGTAIIVFAGILNSLKLINKRLSEIKIVINGAGAAGLSVSQLLLNEGAKDIIICDTTGAIYSGRPNNMNEFKEKIAKDTNPYKIQGKLYDVIKGADIFIGLSAPKTLSQEMIKSMNDKPIIFALANPTPEIMPDEAKQAGAFIVATGRSDFNNQINNSLAFPGIFRGAIDVRARKVTLGMKIAAAGSIASLLDKDELSVNKIIPDSLDTRVPLAVSSAVAKEAVKSGTAKLKIDCKYVQENIKGWILEGQLKNWDDINQFMKPKF